ncbi:LacI family DNA-binding transcriptional regulator [Bifidobacterium xylocopae]|uniref:LacI family transcriptional regulator n=1 Tax=Bifidobacterium xylocopae TaxID=2493119 RepID=A0A366KDF0_9BIFI|nr:LacI family DNA-binding transcriptional regulator [Bifidobacterium xylocopae]RBP99740.1 LacI family transcriptional regulator [Bifidobacterium xylocopae]
MQRKGKSRSVSIVDVARMAGVSHQTVSRVLNRPESVRPATLAAVEQAIASTGYHRNENARALKSAASNCIGILTPDTNEYGPSRILWEVEKAASEQGFFVKTALLRNTHSYDVSRSVDKLLGFDIAAIVIIATETWVESAVQAVVDLPIVSIGSSRVNTPGIAVVDVDQKLGVRMVLDHLVCQGAGRVDHIAGPKGWYSSEERLEGWLDAEARHHLTAGRLYRGDWSEASGYAAGCELALDLPDAVFAANDQMAMGLVRALYEKGISVPSKVLVAGFDDVTMCSYTIPALTSLRQDFSLIGRQAVSCVMSMVAGSSATRFLSRPQLIVRESTRHG